MKKYAKFGIYLGAVVLGLFMVWATFVVAVRATGFFLRSSVRAEDAGTTNAVSRSAPLSSNVAQTPLVVSATAVATNVVVSPVSSSLPPAAVLSSVPAVINITINNQQFGGGAVAGTNVPTQVSTNRPVVGMVTNITTSSSSHSDGEREARIRRLLKFDEKVQRERSSEVIPTPAPAPVPALVPALAPQPQVQEVRQAPKIPWTAPGVQEPTWHPGPEKDAPAPANYVQSPAPIVREVVRPVYSGFYYSGVQVTPGYYYPAVNSRGVPYGTYIYNTHYQGGVVVGGRF